MEALQGKPQTSEELAARLGTSDRSIRRRLKLLPVIAKKDNRRKIYSPSSPGPTKTLPDEGIHPPSILVAIEQEAPANSEKRDNEGDTKGTPENEKKGLSLSLCIVGVLRSEPDRPFVVRDLVDRMGGSYDSVKRVLARLSSTGKSSGPVRRVRHGMYQYAPEKEQDNLQALARSGNWKIENLAFVPLMVYPTPVSLSEPLPGQAKGTPSDTRIPIPKTGYPITLPTGHTVSWDQYENGNQIIRISANGAPPMSPDTALILIDRLGIDDTWKCVSLELNVDSYKHRIDSSYSLQTIEGLLLKAYQHGYNTRVEVADRREVSVREVLDLFHAIAGGIQNRQALREMDSLRKEIKEIRQDGRLALNIA
ncbi:MAG: hypothetical protein PHT99_03545, partial [Methanoregula sp.]|nr:hypothetical protein [Methanoregula sp.]